MTFINLCIFFFVIVFWFSIEKQKLNYVRTNSTYCQMIYFRNKTLNEVYKAYNKSAKLVIYIIKVKIHILNEKSINNKCKILLVIKKLFTNR